MPCVCCFGPLRELPVPGGGRVAACQRCEGAWDAHRGALAEIGRCPAHGEPILSRWGDISRPLPLVQPVFATPAVSELVPILSGDAELHQGMANMPPVLTGSGSLQLDWLPSPRTTAAFTFQGTGWPGVGMGPSRLHLVDTPFVVDLDQHPAGSRWSADGFTAEVTGHVLTDFLRSSHALVEVTAHLVNFPIFLWRELPHESWFGGMRLRSGSWELVLQETVSRDLERAARVSSGFVISHVLRLTRADAKEFSEYDAEHLLRGLQYFFSLARGAWSTPVLAVGRDAAGEIRFRQLVTWNASFARWVPTWFDDQHPQALMELFPEFWRLWEEPQSRETLQRTIYWYVLANESSSADVGLVLAQLALDRLAWNVVFQGSDKGMTPNQRDYTSARIMALLNRFGIPSGIPTQTGKLAWLAHQDHGQRPDLRTGPIALSSARNAIVHPNWKADSKAAEAAVLDGRNLALWYLELSLLAWMKYTGDHQWRLRRDQVTGEVEPVPWARPERWSML